VKDGDPPRRAARDDVPADARVDVRRRLADASTVRDAAERLMDHCVELGYELPSLYLEQGERLRCVAQRGYWHVYDGVPPGAGIMGSTYETGRLHAVRDTAEHAHYIRAIPEVLSEVCTPLRFAGRTVGVLNVEWRAPLDDRDVDVVATLGDAFSVRLAELGGPEPESPAELLARLVHELACTSDGRRLAQLALDGAMRLSGLDGACLVPPQGERRGPVTTTARGRLGPLLEELPAAVSAQLADYVSQATSSYAAGVGDGEGFEAVHALRDRGVESLLVLSLLTKGRRNGVILLVGDRPAPELPSLVPLLEMLAAALASMLDAAGASAALQRSQRQLAHQAMHDPLTGVANRGRLLAVMRAEMSRPRDGVHERSPIVLFVDLDGFKGVNDQHGHRVGDELLVAVADRLRLAARDTDLVARLGGDEFVVLCARLATLDEAVAVGIRILDRLSAPFSVLGQQTAITACIGIASGADLDTAEDLIAAADRAMYEAKRSGKGTWAVAT
jgi:diguanylate cyclase (GGDEF)-like protein